MECTQRLTQEFLTQKKECPEQVGFLGICGNKYPVKKGPNKIGRDPQTCTITLNLNSISRQHAVINVLSKKDIMLMDLESANKTKLLGVSLIPYVPQPLKNGDMVQFGEVFGIFRLLEEEDDLPMTQAMDIPDTPVLTRHMSKLNAATTIPESPDVSDKDDSFIVASQPKGHQFKSCNTNFIKPGKTISIQPISGNKIDNIYWNSSKKSTSLVLDDSMGSLNDSIPFVKLNEKENEANVNNIHEISTQQVLPPKVESKESIFEANTQLPGSDYPIPSLYTANTQLPEFSNSTPSSNESIFEPNTQLPGSDSSIPSLYTANTQLPGISNSTPSSKESIFEANTQLPGSDSPIPSLYTANTQLPGFSTSSPSIYAANTQMPGPSDSSPSIHLANTQMPFHSLSIHSLVTQLPPSDLPDVCKINEQQDLRFDICANKDNSIYNADTQMPLESPLRAKSNSGSPSSKTSNEKPELDKSDDIVIYHEVDTPMEEENFESQAILTDDIFLPINKCVDTESEQLSQIALPKSSKRNMRIKSDSSTDCEDNDDKILLSQKMPEKQKTNDGDNTDCEDEMIELKTHNKSNSVIDITEAIDLEEVATQVIQVIETPPTEKFEDMLTQVIEVDCYEKNEVAASSETDFENLPTQVLLEDDVPSKKPTCAKHLSDEPEISPFKIPLRAVYKSKKSVSKTPKIKPLLNIESNSKVNREDDKYYQDTQDIFDDLCSQSTPAPEVPEPGDATCKNTSLHNRSLDVSPGSSDFEEKINTYVSKLSSQEVRDVIGAETKVAQVKRWPSDASDSDLTPIKNIPFKFTDIDLPNSQEIKKSVSLSTKSVVTESSSDSEPEVNSEDQCTPILFHKKRRPKKEAKINLTNKFDVDALPTRVITRVRKPTSKVQEVEAKKIAQTFLKPKFLTDQEDDIDREIITENITRLKSEMAKNTKDKVTDLDDTKAPEKTKKLEEIVARIKTEVTKVDKNSNKVTEVDAIKNNAESKKLIDGKKLVEPDKIQTNTKRKSGEKDKSSGTQDKPEIKQNTRVSHRKKKSSSPEDKTENIIDLVESEPEKSNKTIEPIENVDIHDNTNGKTRLRESKRYKSAATSKTNDEKSRGPIIVEPHTITITEKPKKREYKRKNKEINSTTEKKLNDSKTNNSDLSIESKRPVRSTRGKRKTDETTTETENLSNRRKNNKTGEIETDSKEKRIRAKKEKDLSPEMEIRRSTRQKPVKEKDETIPIKSILKKSTGHEQSTVYNLSSGSNSDSPRGLKRPAEESEVPVPLPKRVLRATPSRTAKTCYVLFTAFPYEEVKTKLEKMGAIVVTDVMHCTVLLTLQLKRTFKLLCAVGLGKPIVGPNWVQACSDTNMIVDPWLYVIKDEQAEQRFSFSLQRTLVGKRHFLKGYNVTSTPSVMPATSEMRLIVECSGGTWKEGGSRWLCLTCAADKAIWPELRKKGAILVSTELILGGVLQQKLDIETNRIKQ